MINLRNKTVLVTGASSMIGRAVVNILQHKEPFEILMPTHSELDLMDEKDVNCYFFGNKPDYCIHLAGYNGNIRFNSLYPSDIYHKTTIMGLNVLKACEKYSVDKVVTVLSSCGYKAGQEPLKETEFLNGEPDESTEAHAYGKRDLLIYSKLLRKQHDLNAACCIFNTTFGPYDNFDLNKTKVVGSLIKKFVDAVDNNLDVVQCWGSGLPRREIIFSEDVAEGIVQTLEKYDDYTLPLNIGFNEDVSIRDLAEKISKLTGFNGDISWDLSRPDGQFRKLLDSTRMAQFGITVKQTPPEQALLKTINWYKEQTHE